jgi:hypothetical protein
MQVLRELRVIGRRERHAGAQAVTSRRDAERTFGRDVQTIGREVVEHARESPPGQQTQADLGIGRAGDAQEVEWREQLTTWPSASGQRAVSRSVVTTPLTCGFQARRDDRDTHGAGRAFRVPGPRCACCRNGVKGE